MPRNRSPDRRLAVAVSALLTALIWFGAASAQDTPAPAEAAPAAPEALITASSPDDLLKFLQDEGYKFKRDDDTTPRLTSEMDGPFYWIEFQGCTDKADCTDVQFITGWDMPHGISAEKMNKWNQEKLYGKLYRDDDGDPWMTMMVNTDAGVSRANFIDSLQRWTAVLTEFEDYIGWNRS